jgi:single-strand DNA-binding protein
MNETVVTLQGWLGGAVTLREAGEVRVATFRVACTPRRYQRKSDTWVDGDTQWYTVNAWRALADNCAQSLRRGDPVVVHGRLNAQLWTSSAGVEITSFEVDAAFVGHDLNRGVGQFTRTARPATGTGEGADEGADEGSPTAPPAGRGAGRDEARQEAPEGPREEEPERAGRAA